MRFFTCLLDLDGCGIPDAAQRVYESLPRTRGLEFRWQSFGHANVLTAWDDPRGAPFTAIEGDYVAVGVARLDNRADLERWVGSTEGHLADLELLLRTVVRLGAEYVPRVLGDFTFVVWNSVRRTAVMACDAFAVKKLYYAKRNGLFALATRAEALALEERYDVEFLAERVAGCESSPGLSVYEGIKPLPAGTMAWLDGGKLTLRQYWSPDNIEPASARMMPAREAAEILRDLLTEAVRSRLSSNGDTWAQLSGGLDSSSIASLTQWLVEEGRIAHGLAGTVTYVDRQGTGADEREYSDVVATRWRLRNEMIVDPPIWYDDRYAPPCIDQPRPDLMFYPREYRLCEVVKSAEGCVLLTGQGSDEFLRGNMFFFADWLARGRIRSAVREMARRAAIGRVSFWELAYRNAFTPLLPRALRLWLGPEVTRLPRWAHPAIVRRYGLHDRALEMTLYAGRIGHKYHDSVARGLKAIGRTIGHLVLEDQLEVRHPFLYRPLVEFGLKLPPELIVQPHARKWILREAMRGILPDAVRTRVGKGTTIERHAWSLTAQRSLLEPLVQEPILADLGVVDAAELRAVFDEGPRQPQRKGDPHTALQGVLAIEAWLQMRTGRWPRGDHLSSTRSS